MRRGRHIRPGAIVVAVVALTLVTGATLHLAFGGSRPSPAGYQPWIGLPSGGMDAHEHAVRQVLIRTDAAMSLARECGNPFSRTGDGEHYVAHIGAGAFGPPAWRIAMDVRGRDVEIRWSENGLVGAPPPPPPQGAPLGVRSATDENVTLVTPVRTLRLTRTEMDSVRARWRDSLLWDSPQDSISLNCLDGNPVFLEACIGGRYAARMRNCGTSMQATARLWDAFNDVLPAPSPAYWRDGSGRPIPLD